MIKERYKPKLDEEYWAIDTNGEVECVTAYPQEVIDWDFLIGNCFETYEEAEEYKKHIEYTARYKNYIEEHSEPIDWNSCQSKYSVFYSTSKEQIGVEDSEYYKDQGTIYASSEQIIWDAIKEIGEDNFKKYVLEVK